MSRTAEVWHLIAPAPFGGAETVVESLALSQNERGYIGGVILLAPDGPLPMADRLSEAGVRVERVRVAGRNYGAQVAAVSSILHRMDVILHTHGYQADVIGARAARRLDCRIVATNHGYAGGGWRNRFYEWLDRRVIRTMDLVIAVSERNAQRLLAWGHPPDRLEVVPNGWRAAPVLPRAEARRRLGVADDVTVAAWVGRMSYEKGIDLLVDALATRGMNDSITVLLIGDGPERAVAEREVAERGLFGHVRFLGARRDAAEVASAFDLLVISSRTEGLPMVLLEATAADVPVVAFAVGGIPEVLDESSAWLVPPLRVDELAAAITAAALAPNERRTRAAAARVRVQRRLGADQWVAAHEEIYARLWARTR